MTSAVERLSGDRDGLLIFEGSSLVLDVEVLRRRRRERCESAGGDKGDVAMRFTSLTRGNKSECEEGWKEFC